MPLIQLSALMIHFWILRANLGLPQDQKLPWNGQRWKTLTGIHNGLFPDDVSLLPKYLGWTVNERNTVLRLFNSALNKAPKDVWEMMARPPADLRDAIKIWAQTWKKIWDRVNGFTVMEGILMRTDCHPHKMMLDEKLEEFPKRPSSLGHCPQYIANDIFGKEISLRRSSHGDPILTLEVGDIMDRLLSVLWQRLAQKTDKMEKTFKAQEKQATESFNSEWM
jgi:hypothetical protein